MYRFKYTLFLLVGFIFTSCVEDVDFDQADDFAISPEFVSSLIYIEEEANRFVNSGVEVQSISDIITDIDVFEEEFVKDNLGKMEFFFEISNSIKRAFIIQIDFFNGSNLLGISFPITVSPSLNGTDVITEHTETFEDLRLEELKTITTIAITITLQPSADGSTLNENSTGRIGLRSFTKFLFNIDA